MAKRYSSIPLEKQKKIVSQHLKELRKQKGISSAKALSEALAAQGIHLSESRIKQYESGRNVPEEKNLKIFSDFYGVTPEWILGETDFKNDQDKYNKEHPEEKRNRMLETYFIDYAYSVLGIDFYIDERREFKQWQSDTNKFMQQRFTEITGRKPDKTQPRRIRKVKNNEKQ